MTKKLIIINEQGEAELKVDYDFQLELALQSCLKNKQNEIQDNAHKNVAEGWTEGNAMNGE